MPITIGCSELELRHLRYFVAVAEHASVRAASEQLHITQPAISRQIQDLESTLGASLFERTARGIKLTQAGAVFLHEAQDILKRVEAAARLTRDVAAGVHGRIRIGFVESAAWGGLVPTALHAFQQTFPQARIDLVPLNSVAQLAAIAAGELDGGFSYPLGALPARCVSLPLLQHDVVLAAPNTWDLGKRDAVDVEQLADKPFILLPRHAYPAYFDRLIAACTNAGFTPNVIQEAETETAILSLVSAGVGAAIVNSANLNRPPALVRFARINRLSIALPLAFVHDTQNTNPVLAGFLTLLRAQASAATGI